MKQYIQDCVKPLYAVHWAKGLITEELVNSVIMYVAYHDNRITHLMFNEI